MESIRHFFFVAQINSKLLLADLNFHLYLGKWSNLTSSFGGMNLDFGCPGWSTDCDMEMSMNFFKNKNLQSSCRLTIDASYVLPAIMSYTPPKVCSQLPPYFKLKCSMCNGKKFVSKQTSKMLSCWIYNDPVWYCLLAAYRAVVSSCFILMKGPSDHDYSWVT